MFFFFSFQFLLLIFFTKRFLTHKKALKAPKAPKALNRIKTLKQKHKNANKRISDYFPLRYFLEAFLYFFLLVSVLCFLWLWSFWIKKFQIALITSFILLLTIVTDTHFASLKDGKWQMTNDNLKHFTNHNLTFSYLYKMDNF